MTPERTTTPEQWATEQRRYVQHSPSEARSFAKRKNAEERERRQLEAREDAARQDEQARGLTFAQREAATAQQSRRSGPKTRSAAAVDASWKRAFQQVNRGRA